MSAVLDAMALAVGTEGPVTVAGASTRGGAVDGVRCVGAPAGVDWVQADEMTVQCGAGTPVDELAAALAEVGQRVALPDGGTVGGALSSGRSGIRRLGDGPVRDTLLQARYVSAAGEVVQAGGPTVKNVSGFDVCRLLVGSRGTLGFLGEVILRTRPLALASQWFAAEADGPFPIFAALYRPVTVLWDGCRVWALLEGHPSDIAEQAAAAGLVAVDGPPVLPSGARHLAAPGALAALIGGTPGEFVAEVGVGVVHLADAADPIRVHLDEATQGGLGRIVDPSATAPTSVAARVKQQFDPTGRLNPGVVVG